MNRYRVLIVTLAAMALIAGCTSSDDTADEPTTAAPDTTVAPPETVTTAASTTSTTLSETAAIATAEAFQEALNAYDSDAAIALIADGGSVLGATPGNPNWEKTFAEREAWGHQGTLSDCETTDGVLTCLETWERTKFGGQAGIIRVSEWEFRFDDQGLIRTTHTKKNVSGGPDSSAFDAALFAWMATAHPEAYETFTIRENWVNRIDELVPLIDEFVAQSDVYPLGDAAATAEPVADEPTSKVLFVGNSLSYSNGGVEQHVELLAASADPPLIIQTEEIFRHARLASNWEYVSQRGSIEPGAYDMVVLQSTLRGTTEVASFHEAVRSFAERLREAGAEPVLFMAWPITRYGVDPISVEEIAEAHEDIAAELGVRVAPVGLAWQRAMEERPEIDLYAPDQNHPSLLGTYLAAAVIFGTLFGEDFTDLGYLCQDCVTALHPDGLTEDEARFLQRIARETLQEYDQVVDGSS